MAKIKPKGLKRINKNRAIEAQAARALRVFTKEVLKSYEYWILAQFRKKERGEIKSLSSALRINFRDLDKQWSKQAEEFAKSFTRRNAKIINGYVDSSLTRQDRSFKKALSRKSEGVKEAIKSSILEQMALIKTIPQEILRRYENLYSSVDSFDMDAVYRQIKQIKIVSEERARTIARDQVAKAMETYQSARCQQLGFEYYIWSTAGDERVSKGKGGHKVLNNRVYRYDTPSAVIDSYGNVGHCSQRVNCRCTGIPLILQVGQKVKKVRDTEAGDYYILTD